MPALTYQAMMDEAGAVITCRSATDAMHHYHAQTAVLVDIRDSSEWAEAGFLSEAIHHPRGMLEFVIDPASPFHDPLYRSGKPLIFFCAGGWRSALAAKLAMDMGVAHVSHLEGGLEAWKEAGGKVDFPA